MTHPDGRPIHCWPRAANGGTRRLEAWLKRSGVGVRRLRSRVVRRSKRWDGKSAPQHIDCLLRSSTGHGVGVLCRQFCQLLRDGGKLIGRLLLGSESSRSSRRRSTACSSISSIIRVSSSFSSTRFSASDWRAGGPSAAGPRFAARRRGDHDVAFSKLTPFGSLASPTADPER